MRMFSSFQRRTVKTTTGRRLGRCHDLRGEIVSGQLRITGLRVGESGWLAHLGVHLRGRDAVIPWGAVVRIEGRRIVVRDDAD